MTAAAERITICDVGPRDGLQNESRALEPPVRAKLSNRLARAGLPRVEAVSFVNPKRVPQMAGAEEVIEDLDRSGETIFAGLILNERGYDRALAAGVDEVHYAFPATDTFCERNQGTTLAAASALAGRLVDRAHEDGLRVTVTRRPSSCARSTSRPARAEASVSVMPWLRSQKVSVAGNA